LTLGPDAVEGALARERLDRTRSGAEVVEQPPMMVDR
jgi:hypothetical protein